MCVCHTCTQNYQPRASIVPSELDLTSTPYMWPYSRQPLYASALPLVFNATVLNALGVTGRFREAPEFYAEDEGGAYLHIGFEYSEVRTCGCVCMCVCVCVCVSERMRTVSLFAEPSPWDRACLCVCASCVCVSVMYTHRFSGRGQVISRCSYV